MVSGGVTFVPEKRRRSAGKQMLPSDQPKAGLWGIPRIRKIAVRKVLLLLLLLLLPPVQQIICQPPVSHLARLEREMKTE